MNAKDSYMQIYNKYNEKTISYKIKRVGKRGLHSLSSNFNPKLEVSLYQGFQHKPSSFTIRFISSNEHYKIPQEMRHSRTSQVIPYT